MAVITRTPTTVSATKAASRVVHGREVRWAGFAAAALIGLLGMFARPADAAEPQAPAPPAAEQIAQP